MIGLFAKSNTKGEVKTSPARNLFCDFGGLADQLFNRCFSSNILLI